MLRAFAFGKDLWDPSHRFETSWLLPPYALFAVRALMALYWFTVIFFILAWWCTHPSAGGCAMAGDTFSYFTHLTYWGIAFYMLVAAVHTFTYAHRGTPLLDRLPRPLQALHSLFYTSVCVFPPIVTVIYWAVLFDGTWFPREFDAWQNLSQHALNSAAALFEIVVPRTAPPPVIHLLWLIVLLALYLGLAYVTRATEGFYTYSFLDPGENGSGVVAGYILGIGVGCCVVFGLVYGAIWLRVWVTEKKLGMDGKFARQPRWRESDAEMAGQSGAEVTKERSPAVTAF
ncbi:FAR-17a/AIG1-like protein [Pleurostoma richardsiae]|uniref:FAR-17a/AIG1-like protein n=1 Tax=Pleurostoma richardsiae TaxID=41990 RepID=A0AA38VGL4_9PEZI|nr:FAR-17a/AIG1-like protein [Pleurostoma richardsiae]